MEQLLLGTELSLWPKLSVAVFLALFVWLLFWTYRPSAKENYQRQANMPLHND